jgi:hypothetical protein
MTALELFREFQDAQRTPGEFAYFSLLFFVPGVGCTQNISNVLPGEAILGLLNGSIEQNQQPLGIIGIPTLKGLQSGTVPYVKRFIPDDWASGYINQSVKLGIWQIENNPHKP